MRRDRAGVILYFYDRGRPYFILGCDQTRFWNDPSLRNVTISERYQQCELTDFGGGLERGETFEQAALRELEEESEGLYSLRTLRNSFWIQKNSSRGDMRLYFVYLPHYNFRKFEEDREEFFVRMNRLNFDTEILEFTEMSRKELKQMLEKPEQSPFVLWHKIRSVMEANKEELYEFLHSL